MNTFVEFKVCSLSGCIHGGEPQPAENFYKRSNGALRTDCRDCQRQRNAAWRGKGLGDLIACRRRNEILERDEQGRKQCIRCFEWLPESCFSPQGNAGDGFSTRCTRCKSDSRHGLSLERRRELLDSQNGCCGACGSAFDLYGDNTYRVDHDHSCCPGLRSNSCGECIRGLLCSACNFGIAHFSDDPAALQQAASYLEKYNAREYKKKIRPQPARA